MKRLLLTGALLALTAPAYAQPSLVASVENDSFIDGIDRHYTNGLYFSWTGDPQTRDDTVTRLVQNLMLPTSGEARWRESYFFGQSMFTPENLSTRIPPLSDRPYAGWLYGGARLYRDMGDTLDRIDVTAGMVGPASLAGDVHDWWHSAGLFGGLKPEGWHYQLRDEPGLILSQQRIWRVPLLDGPIEMEALPEANFSLGNVFDYAAAGGMLRLGQGLSADWGPPRIAPALQGSDFQQNDDLAWYVFAGIEGRAVARNLFLDGNSFETSRFVPRNNFVADLNAGVALLFPGARLMASVTHRTAEFQGQKGDDQFISLSMAFGL